MAPPRTHWVVIGAGYTGERLAARLVAQGHPVTVTRRSADALAAVLERVAAADSATVERGLLRGAVVDLADRVTVDSLATGDAIVACLAPPGEDPEGEMRTLGRATAHARRVIYVSSTGVYAPGNGAWVDESWPLEPTTTSGRMRLRAERAFATSVTASSITLRAAGIYGPGRWILERIRAGTHRIIGDGTSCVSRIHVDDLALTIALAGEAEVTGAVNVADDDPAPGGEVADAIAAELGVAPSPRVDPSTVSPEIAGMLLADRRIANGRLAELGVTLRYRSWRDSI